VVEFLGVKTESDHKRGKERAREKNKRKDQKESPIRQLQQLQHLSNNGGGTLIRFLSLNPFEWVLRTMRAHWI